MSTITRVYSGNEIATSTEDQQVLHIAKKERASQRGQIWCGGGGRQTAIATSSLDTLVSETTAGWIPHNANFGTRI